MDCLEYISRYRSVRPKNEPLRLDLFVNKVFLKPNQFYTAYSISILFSSITLIATVANVHSINQDNLAQPSTNTQLWPSISIANKINNLAVNGADGAIFVAAQSASIEIYKYSRNLTLLYDPRELRSNDATSNISNFQISSQSNDYINKILLIIKKSNARSNQLLSCWQNKLLSLKCFLHKVDDMKISPLSWSSNINQRMTSDKIESDTHLNALANQGDVIMTASRISGVRNSHNNRKQHITPDGTTNRLVTLMPAIGRYEISKASNLTQKSVLNYRSRIGSDNLYYDYLYVFEYNDYTYFVLNDVRQSSANSGPTISQYFVKLARICNNDPYNFLYSYTEIPIDCNGEQNLYAKAAHLGANGHDSQLYVVFEKNDDDTRKFMSPSYLCSYPMSLIENIFGYEIKRCQDGHESARLLMKFDPAVEHPLQCQKNPSQDWCSSKINSYIDGYSSDSNSRSLDLRGMKNINFIHATTNQTKNVIFLGTRSGYLTKMTDDQDLLYTIDIKSNRIVFYTLGEAFKQVFAANEESSRFSTIGQDGVNYVAGSNNIFAYTKEGNINKFDMDSCIYYTSCTTCLEAAKEPLSCIWCDSHCSVNSDCPAEHISTGKCSPVIRSFKPVSGPTTGSTLLEIKGENFGSLGNRELEVKLGDQTCRLDKKLTTNDTIYCLSPPVEKRMDAPISVKVHEQSAIDIDGVFQSAEPYVYEEVEVYGLNMSEALWIGEIRFTVFGKNMGIGADRAMLLENIKCECSITQHDKVFCSLDTSMVSDDKNQNITLSLSYLIDSKIQPFVPRQNLSRVLVLNKPAVAAEGAVDSINRYTGWEDIRMLFLVISVLAALVVAIYIVSFNKFSLVKNKMLSAPLSKRYNDDDTRENNRYLKKGKEKTSSVLIDLLPTKKPKLDDIIRKYLDDDTISDLKKDGKLIDRDQLILRQLLGKGEFGQVNKGLLKTVDSAEPIDVAIKTLLVKPSCNESNEVCEFLQEGLMMRAFKHENVLELIGLTFESDELPMVITPYMHYGDLRTYVADTASEPTVKDLIDFGVQVARGMAYLSNLKFVHRDLAARNCMLDKDLTVKVADFGLSRDIYQQDYYDSSKKQGRRLPVKWMAIESLEHQRYSSESDVWSYGVLLWELMTRGVVPYPDVSNFDIFRYLKEGRRMLRPKYCPVILYNIMLSCWQEKPALRPTFNELVKSVSNVIVQLKNPQNGGHQQRVSRDETYCDVLK